MASVRISIPIESPPEAVWPAVADVGAVHQRLARGFVVETRLGGGERVVTFENGLVAKELIVDVDEGGRRVAYAVIESALGLRHHHASMEVLADGEGRSRLVWVADLIPDEAEPAVRTFMEAGATAMQRTLDATGP